ncbi:hypothetical protein C8R46DRAFT_1031910 [Mycena filopes]|nr:hypothetical protein C8R46DRAFT_1031910 [Mycena filopes]
MCVLLRTKFAPLTLLKSSTRRATCRPQASSATQRLVRTLEVPPPYKGSSPSSSIGSRSWKEEQRPVKSEAVSISLAELRLQLALLAAQLEEIALEDEDANMEVI